MSTIGPTGPHRALSRLSGDHPKCLSQRHLLASQRCRRICRPRCAARWLLGALLRASLPNAVYVENRHLSLRETHDAQLTRSSGFQKISRPDLPFPSAARLPGFLNFVPQQPCTTAGSEDCRAVSTVTASASTRDIFVSAALPDRSTRSCTAGSRARDRLSAGIGARASALRQRGLHDCHQGISALRSCVSTRDTASRSAGCRRPRGVPNPSIFLGADDLDIRRRGLAKSESYRATGPNVTSKRDGSVSTRGTSSWARSTRHVLRVQFDFRLHVRQTQTARVSLLEAHEGET